MYENIFEDEQIVATLATGVSHIRFLHAAPGAPNVDIYINNRITARNLPYRKFTQYVPFVAGTYNVKVFPTGKTTNPVIDTNIAIPVNGIATAAVIGTLPNVSLYAVTEPRQDIVPGNTYVRFVHLSPTTPAVDVVLPDGKKLFTNVSYKGVTGYLRLKPGTYTLDVKPAGGDTTLLHIPNIKLLPNRFYSVYAVGLFEGKPPLQALIPLDGMSYIRK